MQIRKPFRLSQFALPTGILIFSLILVLSQLLASLDYQVDMSNEKDKAKQNLDYAREALENGISNCFFAARTNEFLIHQYGAIQDFDSVAKYITATYKLVDAVMLTRDGVITHFYSPVSDHSLVGSTILEDKLFASNAGTTTQRNEMLLAGPVEVPGLGKQVVVRLPVFNKEKLVGFSEAMISFTSLLQFSHLDNGVRTDYNYRLSQLTDRGEVFLFPGSGKFTSEMSVELMIPGVRWRLYITPNFETPHNTHYFFLAGCGLIAALLGGIFAWHLVRQPERLKILVKRRSDEIAARERFFEGIIDKSADAVVLLNRKGIVIYQSPSTEAILGYSLGEMRSFTHWEPIFKDDLPELVNEILNVIRQGVSFSKTLRVVNKSGKVKWIDCRFSNLLNDGNIHAIVCNFRDISLIKESEQRANESSRLYEFISKINHAMVHAKEEQSLFEKTCQIAVEIGKFRAAWIGLIEKDSKVVPVAIAGDVPGYFKNMPPIDVSDKNSNAGPTGTAIRSGQTNVCNDLENDPRMKPWIKSISENGFKSSISVPIKKFGAVIGGLNLYSPLVNYFNTVEVSLLEEVVQDISFAIEDMDKNRQIEVYSAENEMLSLVATNTNNSVLITNTRQEIEWVNKSFERLTGYTFAEVKGKIPRTFLQGLETDKNSIEKMLSGLKEKKPVSEEMLYYSKDGHKFWVVTNITPILNEKGELYKYIAIHTDLTEIKTYQDKLINISRDLSELIDNADAVIIGIDHQGKINEWNNRAAITLGYTKEEILGRSFDGLFGACISCTGSDVESSEDLTRLVLAGQVLHNQEVLLKSESGELLNLLMGLAPRRDQKGTIFSIITISQDITELSNYRNSLEQLVRERTEELERSLQTEKSLAEIKSRFASMVSHEFRTPLATMNIAAGFLKRFYDKLSPDVFLKKIDTIEKQIKNMADLLEDVLFIGREQEHRIQVSIEECDVLSFFENLIEEVETQFGRLNIVRSNFNFGDEKLMTDPGLARNIFVNLITNAVKFTPADKPITITGYYERRNIVIKIEDEGIGIPPDKIARMFEPFERGSNAKNIPGTGLGLSIVKRAVDLLKGRITFSSKEGVGTTFVVTLPQ